MRSQRSHLHRLFLLISVLSCLSEESFSQGSAEAMPATADQGIEEPKIRLPEVGPVAPIRTISRSVRRDSGDQLVLLCREAVDTTSRRLLSTEQHTPWQMMHALLGLRQDFVLLDGDLEISGLDWIAQGQSYENEFWFEKTEFGGRAHPYSRPYAFEGHANQFLAILSMCGVELDQEFGTANGTITMRDMIRHAQMTVSEKDEPTWTLWALSRYLPPSARWKNAEGEAWSIERLVQTQYSKPILRGSACGGTHALFALAHARNVYLRQGQPPRGVWLQAEYRIRQFINTARMQQNSNGTLSSNYFRGRKYDPDFNKRMASAGHILEFLMISLPQKELQARWVRRAIEATARDLLNNRKSSVKCSPLYHSVNALNIYLDRVNPRLTPAETARLDSEQQTAELPRPEAGHAGLKPVPITSISRGRDVPSEQPDNAEQVAPESTEEQRNAAMRKAAPRRSANDLLAEPILSESPDVPLLDSTASTDAEGSTSEGRWRATPPERRTPLHVPEDGIETSEVSQRNVKSAPEANDTVEEPSGAETDGVQADDDLQPADTTAVLNRVEAESVTEPVRSESVVEEPLTEEQVAAADLPDPAEPIESNRVPSLTVSSTSESPATNSESNTSAREEQATVPPGINESFLATDLNVDEWVSRFEIESREVYAARKAILEAIEIEEGMAIADVGCGTGLFLKAFADAAGSDGQVFAIDISPRFIDHIKRRVTAEEMKNVTVIRNTANSVALEPHSVDKVFVCDTYHHFEHHEEMLASIREALRPGGELIVIDFERVPRQSREWILNHVRAGKETFRNEIVAAGFDFVEEVDVAGFEENYLLRFQLPESEKLVDED